MKSLIPFCFAGIIFTLLVTLVSAGTISGVASPQPLIKPQVLPQAESPDSKTKQVETTKQQAGTAVVKPATQTVPVLPGVKTIAPLSPSESLQKPAPRVSPAVRSPVPGKTSPVKTPQLRTRPLMKSPGIRTSPLLTRPGVGAVGRKGATAVYGIVVEKMPGAQQADLLVRGKGLNRITSALIFLDNRPVADVTLKRGLATANTLKVSLASAKGKLKNNTTARPGNYELRLRVGMDEFKLLTPIGPAVAPIKIDTARLGQIVRTVDPPQLEGSDESTPPAETPPEGSEGSTPPAGTQPDGPDLIVVDIRQDPPNPVEGQGFNYKIDIRNQGNWAATFPSNTKLIETSINQSFWAWSMGQGGGLNLLPGQTYTVTQNASPVNVGTNPVWARVDPENAVTESNESNNETQGSYTVLAAQGPPDLVITDIHTNPTSPSMATGFSLVITVENSGTSAVEFNQNVDILKTIGTNNILKEGFLRITPGVHTINVMALNIAPGPFNWTVMIDPQNTVTESDETNNSYTISGTISSN